MLKAAAVQMRQGDDVLPRLIRLLSQATEYGASLMALPPIELATTTYPALAEGHQIYLVACGILQQGGQRYHVATLYGPDGHALGRQRQTHLSPQERAAGLSRGDELAVFESAVGRLGLVVNTDVRYPEVARILCLKGANVLVNPLAARNVPAHDWKRRLWREVQANQVFGLEAPLVGDDYSGPATIHAPLGMTPNNDGVLAQAASADADEVVVADLDFAALQEAVDEYPIFRVLNYQVYRRYLPGVYREARP